MSKKAKSTTDTKSPDRTSVSASVEVSLDPASAFRVYTEEIDLWWKRGRQNFYDYRRAVGMRFEPGVGGRLLEIHDDATNDALEIGCIVLWEPARACFTAAHWMTPTSTFGLSRLSAAHAYPSNSV